MTCIMDTICRVHILSQEFQIVVTPVASLVSHMTHFDAASLCKQPWPQGVHSAAPAISHTPRSYLGFIAWRELQCTGWLGIPWSICHLAIKVFQGVSALQSRNPITPEASSSLYIRKLTCSVFHTTSLKSMDGLLSFFDFSATHNKLCGLSVKNPGSPRNFCLAALRSKWVLLRCWD